MTTLSDPDTLFEEVAFVAYHFGWSHDDVVELPHWERRRWCEEISKINERMNEAAAPDRERERERDRGQRASFIDSDSDGIVIQNSLDDR